MLEIADFKLTDMLSSAGATIGIIIGGTIFLQFLSSKYDGLAGRFRQMADEYRGRKGDEGRHAPLKHQIQTYHRRLCLLNRASWLGAVAVAAFLVAVLSGGLSMAFPPVVAIKVLGAGGMAVGLLCMAAAVGFEFVEILLSRAEIHAEVADLDADARRAAG